MPALRWYQREALDAAYDAMRSRRGHPLLSLPTGSGKSWIIGQLCADAALRWGGRVLVLAHRRELLEQNAEKIRTLAPELEVGVFSAGLRRRDAASPVLVATIQSVWNRGAKLGPFHVIAIDEAHLIPAGGEGMYRSFLEAARSLNPRVVFVGLTATPYRMDTGRLYGPGQLFEELTYDIGVKELIAKGFLCPLVARDGAETADTSGVSLRGGDFDPGELEDLMAEERLVDSACREIVELTRSRRAVLLFASGVEHAGMLQRKLRELGETAAAVSGTTPGGERDRVLGDFLGGRLKYLASCDLLTTGFDAPQIDCIALLRPTESPGLYSQMVGRGLRMHPRKANCLVLDYGENIRRHGPIDQVRATFETSEPELGKRQTAARALVRTCPDCGYLMPADFEACPHCRDETLERPRKVRHEEAASELPPLALWVSWHPVESVRYAVHTKRGAPAEHPRTLRAEYVLAGGRRLSEFVCVEHAGPARVRAEAWWRARTTIPCPTDAETACWIAREEGILEPSRILIDDGLRSSWPSIRACELPERPGLPEVPEAPVVAGAGDDPDGAGLEGGAEAPF